MSPDSALYIINLDGDEAVRVRDATEDGARNLFETSVSCIGGTICQQGVRDSSGLLNAMIAAVREAGVGEYLPRFRISGCPSSCGCHQVGIIGLQGASKTVDGQTVPAFKMSINGCGAEGRERMGEEVGTIAQDRIPEMAVTLGKAVRDSGRCFDDWLSSNDIRQVLADYIA